MEKALNVSKVGRLAGRVAGLLPAAQLAVGGVGAVVALAPEANAAPIQSPIVNLALPVTTAGLYLNVVTGISSGTPAGAPGWDLNPWGSGTFNIWANNAASPNDGTMRFPGDSNLRTGNLALGTLVDASGVYGRSSANFFGPNPGEWKLNATNYIGFRFLNEADSQLHFGWASVIVGPTSTDPSRRIGEIWYESAADTGILVGATSAVGGEIPEPSTTLLLATGAAGLLALRHRRQQSR